MEEEWRVLDAEERVLSLGGWGGIRQRGVEAGLGEVLVAGLMVSEGKVRGTGKR